ncbi:MAG TPA: hypothetical protein VK272_05250 [Solirubrobacteraceae bacterium]|nr:hypothetical protein [Solirubrobacteraceae bacterium]
MPTAREGIEFLKARLDSEHQPADLPDLIGSAGFAIVFGPTDFVVVSVEPDAPEHVAITCGILKDVTSDRSRMLEYCNTDTANNPGMPIFSHGRDVLLQTRIPIALVARVPELLSVQINDAPPYAAEKRESWLREEISGEPYVWGGEDLERLYRIATTAVV